VSQNSQRKKNILISVFLRMKLGIS
jgi:hypothetical protein